MDYLILAAILGVVAILIGIGIYFTMIRIFRTGRTDIFMLALLGLVISDFLIAFMAVLCALIGSGLF